MLVTRHFSLIGEKNTAPATAEAPSIGHLFPRVSYIRRPGHEHWYKADPTLFQTVGFCDWVSIYQRHGGNLRKLSDGAFQRIDADGVIQSTTLRKLQLEGSHETSLFVRCDGETVWFEGNVSRFGRPDNVFGYSFAQCLERINVVMKALGLPPFSEGDRFISNWRAQPRSFWTGAVVTRVDMTQNFVTGSRDDAYAFMRWLAGQQASRVKTGVHGEGETVDFGRGSRRVYSKAYLKASELRRHASKGGNEYLEHLANWCDSVGLVRFETTYKATWLHSKRMNFLGAFDMKQLEIDFIERQDVLTRASVEVEDLGQLQKHLLATYRMWQAGDDIASKLSRAAFYRHRRELLRYGVDIAIKSNVVPLPTRTRVIKLGPVTPPDWYELPEIERIANGTLG